MIILFSGTGNTRHCAQLLAERLGGESVYELNAEDLLHPDRFILPVETHTRRLIWMFPVYTWGIPPVIADLIAAMPNNAALRELPHFMVVSCGDDCGDTDGQWRQLMLHRGWRAAEAYSVQMPNTYVCLPGFDVDSVDITLQKLKAAPERIGRIAGAIQAFPAEPSPRTDVSKLFVRGGWAWIKSHLVYPAFRRWGLTTRPFKTTVSCTGCGLCARRCPMDNITITDRRPVWGKHCTQCLRCYHICPWHAILYGPASRRKGQYTFAAFEKRIRP